MTKLIDILRTLVAEMRCRLFDWRHHVHTCGNVELEELTITSENMHHGDANVCRTVPLPQHLSYAQADGHPGVLRRQHHGSAVSDAQGALDNTK
jgi:hypothetical protein